MDDVDGGGNDEDKEVYAHLASSDSRCKAQYLRCSYAGETLARYPEGDSGSFRTFFVHCLIGFKMTGKNFSQLVTMWHDENP